MRCEVHILAKNEEEILPYTLRHYATFCQKIVLHDAFSTDRTREIATSCGCEIRDWHDPDGKFDDRTAVAIKNTAWRGTTADWVICADADELIYFPSREPRIALAQYIERGIAVVKPHGFELVSKAWPTTTGQIYDEVKMGARDDKWYGKAILFTPHLVKDIHFGMGAHETTATLRDGSHLPNPARWSTPACYLLHCKHLGPIDRIARLYDEKRSRLCDNNVAHRYGNFEPGIKHALDKRNKILSNLERVIA
jgi:glycosyltransferase involved in cell wall biosynthesis